MVVVVKKKKRGRAGQSDDAREVRSALPNWACHTQASNQEDFVSKSSLNVLVLYAVLWTRQQRCLLPRLLYSLGLLWILEHSDHG